MKSSNTILVFGVLGALAAGNGCYATASDGRYPPSHYVQRGQYVDVHPGVRVYHIGGVYHTYDATNRRYVRYQRPVVRANVNIR